MKNTHLLAGKQGFSRRNLLKRIGAGAALLGATGLRGFAEEPAQSTGELYKVKNGRIHQSVIFWCFNPMTPVELAGHASDLGMASVELVPVEAWPELTKRGLVCAMASSHGWRTGFAQTSQHEECIKILRERIDQCAAAGFEKVITFSGFRNGQSDEVATKNMIEGLKKVAGYAEQKKVTLCIEMLNSRVHINMKGHPDYFCDNIDRTVDICKQISSERVKVLFDIYHVQIMHGDIISHIRQHHPWIAHYHTAGVPGRNEIDDTQEINYAPIMQAILETGYKEYVGQEFVPLRDKVASLSQAVKICDV
jgi:hydroxypyruvate isomerase